MPLFNEIITGLENQLSHCSQNDAGRLKHAIHVLRLYSYEGKEGACLPVSHHEHLRFWLESLPDSELIKLMRIYCNEAAKDPER